MTEGIYEKLRELMSLNPMGCPPAPEIIKILHLLFTEKEAEVALGLGFFPFTINEVSYRTGIPEDEAKIHLESLANKGVVFAREKNGSWGYALVNTFHLFENPFRKGIHDELIDELTPLWKSYIPVLEKNFGSKKVAISRVIPINEKIKTQSEVLPYEKVSEMINRAKTIGIGHCACRELEQNCNAPKEACMMFDNTCNYLVDRGFAKLISKDEALRKIKEFDEMGLVRMANNTQDKLEFICHCCSCCCSFLRAFNKQGNLYAFAASSFYPEHNLKKCSGCGVCADDKCPTISIKMIDEKPEVDMKKCIGCGICAARCPEGAIKLIRKNTDRQEPPANLIEFGLHILQEKGKLEAFMEVNTPKTK
ncbi:MAG: 4Fe-4S binding protein [Desulfobacula sp.]|nr:4Fe-4S binding protein [Desulfobacula sp.]